MDGAGKKGSSSGGLVSVLSRNNPKVSKNLAKPHAKVCCLRKVDQLEEQLPAVF